MDVLVSNPIAMGMNQKLDTAGEFICSSLYADVRRFRLVTSSADTPRHKIRQQYQNLTHTLA